MGRRTRRWVCVLALEGGGDIVLAMCESCLLL